MPVICDVLLGLGSNLGDRQETLRAAWGELGAVPEVETVRISRFHETQAAGGPADQPNYLNAVGLIRTSLTPQRLLDVLHDIERRFGRVRTERWGPRTLDLDILLFGELIAKTETLTIPHPEMLQRDFVMEPAVEIAPDFWHPGINLPLRQNQSCNRQIATESEPQSSDCECALSSTEDPPHNAPLFPYRMEIRFNNLYTHFVFAVENRQPIIKEENRERIEKYITGIVNNHQCKLYAVYANPDHVHFLVSRSPEVSEHRLAKLVAEGTETFINANILCCGKFRWQTTCSAFSVSKKEVDKVCRYILNQPEHHKRESFAEEFDKITEHYLQALSDKGIRAR